MARHAWPNTLESMVKFTVAKKLPLSRTELEQIARYYVSQSPESLPIIADDLADCGLKFSKKAIGELEVHEKPQVTSVKLADVNADGQSELIVTDNLNESISELRRSEDGTWEERILAKGPAPVNSTAMDVDSDGDVDFGISLMGFMHPNDRMIGEFHLLINDGQGQFSRQVVLQGDVPRITDCAPGDFDGDGDIDIVLAMFGWRDTGEIGFLEQVAPLQFKHKTLLQVNGVMRVITTQLDDDPRPDFLALITQQHEVIARFLNVGKNQFRSEIISRANHPTFGSSSIFVEDLDQDGDEDILYTNGDMMDENPEPKPYHGVRWLENNRWKYSVRYLTGMPGCYDAKPVDMDGDGDLDVVYSALYFQWKENDFPSLAWLENLGGFRKFTARKIAYSPSNLANIAVGDLSGDGKPDIVGGGMHVPGPADRAGRLTLWLQE